MHNSYDQNVHTQPAHTRSAAAPAARSAGTSRKVSRRRKENSPELERIIGTTVQAILLAAQNEVPGTMQMYAVGQALHEGEIQLENAETTRKYGSRFVNQVSGRCGFHSRKARHCLDLVMTFSRAQAAQLAQAALPFRQLREALAFVGDGAGREARIAALLARVPKDSSAAVRRPFVKWLTQQHVKRNPLTAAHRWVLVTADGQINSKVMTQERARALAHGRRIMEVKPVAN